MPVTCIATVFILFAIQLIFSYFLSLTATIAAGLYRSGSDLSGLTPFILAFYHPLVGRAFEVTRLMVVSIVWSAQHVLWPLRAVFHKMARSSTIPAHSGSVRPVVSACPVSKA